MVDKISYAILFSVRFFSFVVHEECRNTLKRQKEEGVLNEKAVTIGYGFFVCMLLSKE
ncbi:hypothetical protein [Bartonella krasnovii]|uniref:hypothetical protein n=1 Tax=Bartonella krasnovii TaxID=2267275 RepID=UPI001F4CC196|nr:hypothetical protein [Bartonella krasnovii]UNF38697.1 hypothetical protein MNL10_08265 [Bartonella krasnovii]UNF40425.1 hypothetical protein MNL09_08390 [Bartonella krasnovii]UNF50236.1 hypothetical protein MNL03_08210 [Bartonella krasnovii]UNF51940.1 hypothetical protein MNL02_07815 [Bartonella krasnovii]